MEKILDSQYMIFLEELSCKPIGGFELQEPSFKIQRQADGKPIRHFSLFLQMISIFLVLNVKHRCSAFRKGHFLMDKCPLLGISLTFQPGFVPARKATRHH